MSKDTPRSEPAWTPHPGPEVTLRPAVPGEVRTGRNGVQWYLGPGHSWQPVTSPSPAPKPQRQPEWEAGQ